MFEIGERASDGVCMTLIKQIQTGKLFDLG